MNPLFGFCWYMIIGSSCLLLVLGSVAVEKLARRAC
jgi:hypothetical protein